MAVYLELFHGRRDPDEDMDDWGFQGPIIGPLKYVHITYQSNLKIASDEDEDRDIIFFHDDMIYYDGAWYGDWSITDGFWCTDSPFSGENGKRVIPLAKDEALFSRHASVRKGLVNPTPKEFESWYRDELYRRTGLLIGDIDERQIGWAYDVGTSVKDDITEMCEDLKLDDCEDGLWSQEHKDQRPDKPQRTSPRDLTSALVELNSRYEKDEHDLEGPMTIVRDYLVNNLSLEVS